MNPKKYLIKYSSTIDIKSKKIIELLLTFDYKKFPVVFVFVQTSFVRSDRVFKI